MSKPWEILHGDVRRVCKTLAANSFDAMLGDPPYGLSFMGKRWDYSVPSALLWSETERVLKPGAHAMIFGGSRTFHRTCVAVEDGGLIPRDLLFWLYGSGFPKSHDVSKAIDKKRDDTDEVRVVCRFLRAQMEAKGWTSREIGREFEMHSRMVDHWAARDSDSQPNLPTLDQWLRLKTVIGFSNEMDAEVKRLNWRKGEAGDAWKGAEIVGEYTTNTPGLAGQRFAKRDATMRAPTEEAEEWLGFGTALKPSYEPILLARKMLEGTVAENALAWGSGALAIDGARIGNDPISQHGRSGDTFGFTSAEPAGRAWTGRWPGNIILSHNPGCTMDGECEPGCMVRMLDEQSGERPGMSGGGKHREGYGGGMFGGIDSTGTARGDSGGSSRFFYTTKADRYQRNAGLDAANTHTTVKPIDLIRYLAALILPPKRDTPRRILVPFSGVASEMIGCMQAGWDEVVGIEREAEYIEIAKNRITKGGVLSGLMDKKMRRRKR
jgi:hypothetical protein